MANMTKASINTFCMLTLGPWPSMQAALPSLPQWALGILGGHKVQETSLGPRTVSREPHMRCRPIRRSNCTPQWTGKSRLQSLSKAPWKLNVARLVSALVSPQIRNGRQFPSKGRIYNISYIYIYLNSYHIISYLYRIPQSLFLIDLITFGMLQEYQGLGHWNPSNTTPGLRHFATEDSFTVETVRPQAENLQP